MSCTHIVFICNNTRRASNALEVLAASGCVGHISVIVRKPVEILSNKITFHISDQPYGSQVLLEVLQQIDAPYFSVVQDVGFRAGLDATLSRHAQVLKSSGSIMVYNHYVEWVAAQETKHPLIPFQKGSLRNDFDFGLIQTYSSAVLPIVNAYLGSHRFTFSGRYALQLAAAELGKITLIPEYLYQVVPQKENDDSHFAYLEKDQQIEQKEMEQVCNDHLRSLGALVLPPFKTVAFEAHEGVKASVIIPVRNRAKTILDAVYSALAQKTDFTFNVIVVDNYSDDGTNELLKDKVHDERLVVSVPKEKNLGIGGCWNHAIRHQACGLFAVQLDSDDLYLDDNTLQKVVDKFEEEKCAMVIGAYKLVDFDLNDLPPGVIDHREWTDENGANNALRINGFGAPRAFYTPLAKEIGFPNVSYGEDYAMALRMASEYKVGRIYNPLYLCRRWNDNTDASLSVEKKNEYNYYKDWVRTMEVERRLHVKNK